MFWRKQQQPAAATNPCEQQCKDLFTELLLKIACLQREIKCMNDKAAADEYSKFVHKVERFPNVDDLIIVKVQAPPRDRGPQKFMTGMVSKFRRRPSTTKAQHQYDGAPPTSGSSESQRGLVAVDGSTNLKSLMAGSDDESEASDETGAAAAKGGSTSVFEENSTSGVARRPTHHYSSSGGGDWTRAAFGMSAVSYSPRASQEAADFDWLPRSGNFHQGGGIDERHVGGNRHVHPSVEEELNNNRYPREPLYPQIHGGLPGQGQYMVTDSAADHHGRSYPESLGHGDSTTTTTTTASVSNKVFGLYRDLLLLVRQHYDKERDLALALRTRCETLKDISSDILLLHDKLRSVLADARIALPKTKVPQLDASDLYERTGSRDDKEVIEVLWAEVWDKAEELKQRTAWCKQLQAEHRAQDARLRSEMKAGLAAKDEQMERLNGHLKKLEQENAKASQSGSYVDTAATPTLLDDHLKVVKELLLKFARVYEKTMAEAGLNIGRPNDDAENGEVVDQMSFARGTHSPRFRAAYWISTVMFRAFEIDGFDVDEGYFCESLDLEESHAACFSQFQELRSRNILDLFPVLQANVKRNRMNHRLLRFFRRKFEAVTPPALHKQCWEPGHPFFKSFLCFAHSVWMLQRLAMSFEPVARIFRVKSGARYDEQYMSNVVGEDEEEEGGSVFKDVVGVMVVPGFRVGKIVIRSQVYLQAVRGCDEDN